MGTEADTGPKEVGDQAQPRVAHARARATAGGRKPVWSISSLISRWQWWSAWSNQIRARKAVRFRL